MQRFLMIETDNQSGAGVPIWGPVHLAWLFTALLCCLLITIWFSRRNRRGQDRAILALALANAASEIFRDLVFLFLGRFDPSYMLPLHLCGVMIWVELYAAWKRSPLSMELCYCLGMPGALCALITPGITNLPWYSLYYLQFAFSHTVLFLVPVLMLARGFRPNYRLLGRCLLVLALIACVDGIVNDLFHANYLFLSQAAEGSLLGLFRSWVGDAYLIPTVGVILAVWAVLYLPYELWKKRGGPPLS